MDLSPLRKWEILGPDAEALVQKAITRDARRLSVGQVTYTALCNETGGMIDDATVYRLGQDNFRFVGGDEYDGIWLNELAERAGAQGVGEALDRPAPQRRRPGAREPRELLKKIVWTPPTQTLARGSQVVPLHGRPHRRRTTGSRSSSRARATRASSATRSGATRRTARRSGTRSGGRGAEHGLTPLGLEALDILRIESGLIFAGYEFDDQVDPFEAGIGFAVDLRHRRRLHRAHGARGAARASAARARRARARGQRDRRPRRRGVHRPPARRRRHERHAQPGPQEEHRARRGSPCSTPGSGRSSRSASSTGCRSASRRRSSASRSTTPRRRGPLLIESFTEEQVEAFRRDGFLIVEAGLVSDDGLERLRERYLKLFDGEYETGIRPDEVNWVLGRDPEDRTRQTLQRVEVRQRRRRPGARGAYRASRRSARPLLRRPDPPGQRPLEATRHEGDRIPPGLLVRRLPRSVRDDHVLDLAPRDAGGRGAARVRPRLARVAEVAAGAVAVPRAGRLARGPREAAPEGAELDTVPVVVEGRRRLLPSRAHLARIRTQHLGQHRPHGARLPPRARWRHASTRRTSTSRTRATGGGATSHWTSRSSRWSGTSPATGHPGSPTSLPSASREGSSRDARAPRG